MEEFSIQNHLARWKTKSIVSHALLAIVVFLAGLVVLFFTFWLTYVIIWFGGYGISAISELAINKRLHIPHSARLIGSGTFLVLLFIQHFRTSPLHWGDYPRRDYAAAPALQMQLGATGSLIWLLAYPGASANMIADLLLTGPRLAVGSWQLAAKMFQIKRVDTASCSNLLGFLLQRGHAVPYEELREAGWEPWFEQLHQIEGVNFLEKGLSLSDELKAELRG